MAFNPFFFRIRLNDPFLLFLGLFVVTSFALDRFIFVPMLLLAAFLGLFVAAELSETGKEETVYRIVNAPVLTLVAQMKERISSFESVADLYNVSTTDRAESLKEIKFLWDKVRETETVLTASFMEEALSAKENIAESDKLNAVKDRLQRIEGLLPKTPEPMQEEAWAELKKSVDALKREQQILSASIRASHRKEANLLLREMKSNQTRRDFLSALVLLSGLGLVFSLMWSVFFYRRSAQRALAAERYNALFAAALQSTRVGVLMRDAQKKERPVIFVNEAFTRMTGYRLEDISSDTSEFLFGWNTDPASIVAFRRAFSLQETVTLDLLIYRKDGSPFWSEWHLSPVLDANGILTHFVSLFTDTTALRQAQEELIQAKQLAQHANAVKTSFLAMMSHEIRTPINGILGVLKLVEETTLDDEQRHLISIAETSSHALHGIINDILDYAKMEAGKVEIVEEPFVLTELLSNITGLFQTIVSEKGIELQLDIAPDIPNRFISDPGRIRQILLNLLSNAIKFTDKGFVRLRILSLMGEEIGGEPGLLVRFEVQDTGIGISPEDQEKLFKEFSQVERSFTRRFGGTGLGLAISRRLVEMLRGEIGMESQPGKGSKFWFILPLRLVSGEEEPATAAMTSEPPPLIDPQRLYHVLLVEDNATNRLVARRYLEKAGFLVEEAVNGLEAVEKAKAAAFDVILMDVSMPEMDGMLATCHIRALGGRNERVPIIALTAHVMTGDRELCLAAGMNDYLNNPLEYEALLRKMELWLHVRFGEKHPAPPIIESPQMAPPAPYDDPDFEPKVLERMKKDLGAEAVAEVTQVFLADSLIRIKEFEKNDLGAIYDAAHMMKSCSANCGLIKFSRLMEALEKASGQGDRERISTLLPLVQDLYTVARSKLETERTRYTA